MKKQIFTLIAIFIASISFAQTGGFNYKALIVDNGTALNTQSVTLKFTVLENGTISVYQETQTATTDANGIVSVNVGEGTTISGTFTTIDWGANPYFLKVEIDTGSGFADFGTSEFKTVPYAKYADKAGNAFSGNFSDLNGIPTGLADGDDSFSGNYNDLTNTPVLFNLATTTNPATSVTQSVYHTGNVAVGTDETDALVSNRFRVKSSSSDIVFGPTVQNSAAIDVSSNLQNHNTIDAKQNNSYTLSSKSAIHTEYLTDKVISDIAYYRYENGGLDKGYYGMFNQINPTGVRSFGVRNRFNITANNEAVGILNEFGGTSDQFIYGTINDIAVAGNGFRIGVYNSIDAASSENSAGSFNTLTNTSTGKLFGSYTEIEGAGTGDKYGAYNKIEGSGDKYGIYNEMTEGGVGVKNEITNAGTAISNDLTGTDGNVVLGINTSITNSGNGIFIGESALINSAGTGDKYGVYAKITTGSGGKHYAIYGEAEKAGADVYAGYFKGDAKITESLKIGTADTSVALGVKADPVTELVRFSSINTGNGNDVLDLEMEEPSTGTAQFIECNTDNTSNVFTVDHNGDINTKGELHGKDTGTSDMKAYIYGSVDADGSVDTTASSGGFTVTHTNTSTNGTYRINFTNAPGNTNYIVVATFKDNFYGFIYTSKSTTNFYIKTRKTNGDYYEKAFEFVVYKK